MLIGLTLRGVAFDFRVKARAALKPLWNRAFFWFGCTGQLEPDYMLGSLIAALTQAAGSSPSMR
jgi:cytochrome d ubiquinol oxidase subunit II